MDEVGCRATRLLLEIAEREGLDVGALVRGLPVTPVHLRDRRRRIDWDVWIELVERLARQAGGGAGLRRIGLLVAVGPEVHPFKRIAPILASARQLYHLNARWAVSADIRCIRAVCVDLPDGRVRLTMRIPADLRGSAAMFELSTGLLQGLPRLIGQPDSLVTAEIDPHGGTWTITPPPSRTLWARLRGVLAAGSAADTAAQQLAAQQQEISAQYEALRRSEARWRSLVENAPGLLFEVAADGAGLVDRVCPGRREAVLAAIAGVLATGTPADLEIELTEASGTRPYAGRIGPLDGRSVIVLLTDVSDRKRAEAALRASEEQLRQAQKMEAIGRLAGGIAHDFNNLLTVIMAHAGMLLRNPAVGATGRSDLEPIAAAAQRAAELVRQLLAFSRRQMLSPSVVDLNEVVAEMLALVRRLIGEDIRVLTELDEGVGHALVDRSQLEQVILNLVVNARDAMPQGGVLGIATREVDIDAGQAGALGVQPGRHLLLSVSDTGTGMDEATRARIFEPFFTTKEVGSGSGLGLATVRGIVEQSGGGVWVYSEPGLGSTFRICLPCAPAEAPVDARRVEVALASLDGTETILLVEDEPLVRAVARRALEERGYRVLEASSPDHALALALEPAAAIDLLVTDVIMPGMTGSDLVAALRPTLPTLPVLYVSGYAQHMIFARGIVVDDASILEKPFTADLLARRVREMLARPVQESG